MIITIKTIADTIRELDISKIYYVYYKPENSKIPDRKTILPIPFFTDDCGKNEEGIIEYIDKGKTRRIVDARIENDMLVILY